MVEGGTDLLDNIHLDNQGVHCLFPPRPQSYTSILTCLQLLYYTRLDLDHYAMQGMKFTGSLLALSFAICIITFYEECYPLSKAWDVLPSAPNCAVGHPHPSSININTLLMKLIESCGSPIR